MHCYSTVILAIVTSLEKLISQAWGAQERDIMMLDKEAASSTFSETKVCTEVNKHGHLEPEIALVRVGWETVAHPTAHCQSKPGPLTPEDP